MSRDLPWLKWYPEKARGSVRWRSLTVAERGLFRDLYDIAALSPVRGQLVTERGPITDKTLAADVGVAETTFGALLAPLLEQGLIVRNVAQTLVFPDFARHQRNGPLRPRGADLAQEWRKNGALELDVELEKELEAEKEEEKKGAPQPPKVLQCREFRAIWAEWLEYRKKARFKQYVSLGLTRLWNKLGRWADEHGVPFVVAAIESSIENGYQGIFPPKGNNRPKEGNQDGAANPTGKSTGRTYKASTKHEA